MAVKYNPETMCFESQDDNTDRKKLIKEGIQLADRLKYYREDPPSVRYLTSSQLWFSSYELRANRYNLNLSRVPLEKIQELVDKTREKHDALGKDISAILDEFRQDVAEICFSKKIAGNKPELVKLLAEKKGRDLRDWCNKVMPRVNNSEGVGGGIPSTEITFRVDGVTISIYPYSDRACRVYYHYDDMGLISKYKEIKAELNKMVTDIFKEA